MISWGTKVYRIGETDQFPEEECLVCKKRSKIWYLAEQGNFRLYGLPLFPKSVNYYRNCKNCDSRLKVSLKDPSRMDLERIYPKQNQFKYYWGWLFLTPILIGIIYLLSLIGSAN